MTDQLFNSLGKFFIGTRQFDYNGEPVLFVGMILNDHAFTRSIIGYGGINFLSLQKQIQELNIAEKNLTINDFSSGMRIRGAGNGNDGMFVVEANEKIKNLSRYTTNLLSIDIVNDSPIKYIETCKLFTEEEINSYVSDPRSSIRKGTHMLETSLLHFIYFSSLVFRNDYESIGNYKLT